VARVPLVKEGERAELDALIGKIKAERGGRLLDLYAVLLNSPPIAEGWLKLFTAIRQQSKLNGGMRELAILRVALLNGAAYEYRAHVPFALKEGLPQEKIDALEGWRESKLYSKRERAVLAYTDAMTRDVEVSPEVFAAVREFFGDAELVELTGTIAAYNMVSRFLVALEVGA